LPFCNTVAEHSVLRCDPEFLCNQIPTFPRNMMPSSGRVNTS